MAELDAVVPNHPVPIHHRYRLTLLNTKAVEWYGYHQPGHPTSQFLAAPSDLVIHRTLGAAPKLSICDQINSAMQYFDVLNSLGATSVSDAGGGGMELRDADPYMVIRWLHGQNLHKTRIGYHPFPQIKGEELSDSKRWTAGVWADQGDEMLKFVGAGENLAWAFYDFEIFADERRDIDEGAEDYQRQVMTVLGEAG